MGHKLNINDITDSEKSLENKRAHGFTRFDPRIKIALLILVLILNIGLAIAPLTLSLLILGLIFVVWTRPPLKRTLIFLLAPLIPTAIAFIGFSFAFGKTPIYSIANITFYKEGILEGLNVVSRVYCDIFWLTLTFATEQFPTILKALRWYKMPAILVDTLAMMYRYSFLLYEEFTKMNAAALSRGGRSSQMNTIKTISRIAAQIFINAFNRSERIYLAKLSRGGE